MIFSIKIFYKFSKFCKFYRRHSKWLHAKETETETDFSVQLDLFVFVAKSDLGDLFLMVYWKVIPVNW